LKVRRIKVQVSTYIVVGAVNADGGVRRRLAVTAGGGCHL